MKKFAVLVLSISFFTFMKSSESVSTDAQMLLYAGLNGHDISLIKEALLDGANPLAFDKKRGQTALHYFLEQSSTLYKDNKNITNIIDTILDHLHEQHRKNQRSNFKERILKFLRYRSRVNPPESFSVDVENIEGITPLAVALIYGYKTISILLQEKGLSNINYQNKEGNTALHYMAQKCATSKNEKEHYRERINFALSRGANINLQNKEGQTPLMIAALYKNYDAIQIFLDHIPPHKEDDRSSLPLYNALLRDNNNKTAYDYAYEIEGFKSDYLELLKSACNIDPISW